MAPVPLSAQRFQLPFKGVAIECLDSNRQPIARANASGFVLEEGGKRFLYTCWHVVTGFDPSDVRVGLHLPKRRFLRIAMQATEARAEALSRIGGRTEVILPLYDETASPSRPLWYQDVAEAPQADLNAIGLRVPALHDAVKLPIPENFQIDDWQTIQDDKIYRGPYPNVGDKVLVVGYPHGYSTRGSEQPTPVVLTRFIAASRLMFSSQQFLLESTGAPGMSGGPVFLEADENLSLLGIYVGLIYPDHQFEREKSTALGKACDMRLVFHGHAPLAPYPLPSSES